VYILSGKIYKTGAEVFYKEITAVKARKQGIWQRIQND